MYESREQYVRSHIGELAEEAFPDDVGIEWRVLGFEHKQALGIVEVVPSENSVGYEKFKLSISFEQPDSPSNVAVYAFEAGGYFLLSAIEGYKDELPRTAADQPRVAPNASSPGIKIAGSVNKIGIWFEGVFSTASPLVLAAILMTVWITPMSVENGSWVRLIVGILALEFIMIHSGIMLSALARVNMKGRWWLYGGLLLVYSLFVLAITISFKSWYFMIVYSAIMLARWQSMLRGEDNFNESMIRSGVSIFNLVITILIVAIVPVSRLGITDRVLSLNPIDATGGWIDHPENALATGVVYFSLMAVYEWLAMKYRLRMASEGRPAFVTSSSTSIA